MQPKKKIKKYKYDFHFKQILELERHVPEVFNSEKTGLYFGLQ